MTGTTAIPSSSLVYALRHYLLTGNGFIVGAEYVESANYIAKDYRLQVVSLLITTVGGCNGRLVIVRPDCPTHPMGIPSTAREILNMAENTD